MILRIVISIILISCFSISPHKAVLINTAFATQKSAQDVADDNLRTITGEVIEIISSAGFTYTELDTGKGKVWAAAPGTPSLKKGDVVSFSSEMPMRDFHSKTLGRNFQLIYFVKQFISDKGIPLITAAHGQADTQHMAQPDTTGQAVVSGEVNRGNYLREATLNGLNGKQKKLSDFKGKPLIINVWASWCGPCRAEMGSLENLSQRYNGKQFNVIGISTDDYRNKAVSFIEQTGITFENYHDSKLIMESMLGANMIPLTVLVDENGRILEKVRGAREWDTPEIVHTIGEVFRIKLTDQTK